MRSYLKRWAAAAVAAVFPKQFSWSHRPIINREHGPRRPVVLGRDTQFEGRESPTSWGLDPLANAVMRSVILSRATDQLQSTSDRSFPEFSSTSSHHPDSLSF